MRGFHFGKRLAAVAASIALSLFALAGNLPSLAEDPDGGQANRRSSLFESSSERYQTSAQRLRQGTKLEKVRGQFRIAGDRIAFYPDELAAAELTVLENLALERLSAMVVEDRNRMWIVSGTVTEYRGKNYLLVSRAVMSSVATPQRRQP